MPAEPRPFPLVRMPIVVADEHIHLDSREQRPRIDTRLRVNVDPVEEGVAADDLARARETGTTLGHVGTLLQLAEHTRKLCSEFAENRIVRHYRDGRMRVKDADGGLKWISRDRSQWMRSTPLVADDVPDDGPIVLLGQNAESFLHRAEHVLQVVGRLESERYGLRPPSRLRGLESAVKSPRVENGHLYRRRPLIAVVVAQENAMKMSRLVDLAGDDDHAICSNDSRRVLSCCSRNRGRHQDRRQSNRSLTSQDLSVHKSSTALCHRRQR